MKMNSESLERLFEAYETKDEQRINDILSKTSGDLTKAKSLAVSMANKITDYEKAKRRAEAAHDYAPELEDIFLDRAKELKGDTPNAAPITKPAEVTITPKAQAVVKKSAVGDLFRVTGKNVRDDDFMISNGKRWMYIVSDSSTSCLFDIPSGPAYNGGSSGSYSPSGRSKRSRPAPSSSASAVSIGRRVLDLIGDDTILYFRATKISGTWIEGKIVYTSLISTPDAFLVRIKPAAITKNESILSELENDKLFSKLQSKFFKGDEDFIMSVDGNAVKDFSPGAYVVQQYNIGLSEKKGELVVVMTPKGQSLDTDSDLICAKLNSLEGLTDKPSKEQSGSIADWLSKELGATVNVGRKQWGSADVNQTDYFHIPWFNVKSSKKDGYLSNFEKSPFFTKEDAQKEIEYQQKLAETKKLPYATDNMVINQPGFYDVPLSQLLEYAKLVGIDIKLTSFFEKKRGDIKARQFGF